MDTQNIEIPWQKIDKNGPNGCWLWTGARIKKYGQWSTGYRKYGLSVLAHRALYTILVGPIPDDLTLDHLCRVPHCVNPDHLEVVTLRRNAQRARGVTDEHCKRGHPWTEESTVDRGNGQRQCRICRNERMKEWRKRNRGYAADYKQRKARGEVRQYTKRS